MVEGKIWRLHQDLQVAVYVQYMSKHGTRVF